MRYDTPSIHGLKLSTSAIADSRWDVGAQLRNTYGDFKVRAAVGFGDVHTGNKFNRLSGSISALHLPTGLSATVASGRDDPDTPGRDNPRFVYGKLGYQANLLTVGKSAFSVDWFHADDFNVNDSDGDVYGFQFVQKFDPIATEAFVALRNFEHDQPGLELDDILASLIGARIKF